MALKSRWEQRKTKSDSALVWDGIIDKDKWDAYHLKLAFILKEAFSKPNDEDWDIAKAYAEDGGLFSVGGNANAKQAMHNRIVEWAYAIDAALHNKDAISQDEAQANDHALCRKVMLSSAYINIKKINGSPSSSYSDLVKIAERDKELIINQIKLINPNVILFCSTFDISRIWRFIEPLKLLKQKSVIRMMEGY